MITPDHLAAALLGHETLVAPDVRSGESSLDAIVRSAQESPAFARQLPEPVVALFTAVEGRLSIALLDLMAALPNSSYFDVLVTHCGSLLPLADAPEPPSRPLFSAVRALASNQRGKSLEPSWVKLAHYPPLSALAWRSLFASDARTAIHHLGPPIEVALRTPNLVDLNWLLERTFFNHDTMTFADWASLFEQLNKGQQTRLIEAMRSPLLAQLDLEPVASATEPHPVGVQLSAAWKSLSFERPHVTTEWGAIAA